jgi:hypothetical protein
MQKRYVGYKTSMRADAGRIVDPPPVLGWLDGGCESPLNDGSPDKLQARTSDYQLLQAFG